MQALRRVALALTILAVGCASETSRVAWRFDTSALVAPVRVVATIERGGCGGVALHTTDVTGGAPSASSSPLDPGRYGFRGVAYDATCARIADTCVEARLPRAAELVVALTPIAPAPCDGRCAAGGVCQSFDAGPADGGSDAGSDGGIDAGLVPATPTLRWPHSGEHTAARFAVVPEPRIDATLRWDPVATAASYEVQVWDRTASTAPPSLDESPPVAVGAATTYVYAPAVGVRASWRVRACNAFGCSAFSRPWHLDVRKTPGDFDDDGHEDLVVGSRVESSFRVVQGRAIGSLPAVLTEAADAIDYACSDGEVVDPSSTALARLGDLDGDGFADLGVGMPSCSGGRGEVLVFWGASVGLRRDSSTYLTTPGAIGGAAQFGAALSRAGDVDGDGWLDFVIGAPAAMGGGAVAVVFGGVMRERLDVRVATAQRCAFVECSVEDEFGADVAGGGDVDLDGFSDVVVGAPGSWNGRGTAYVLRGDANRERVVADLDTRAFVACDGGFTCCVPSLGEDCMALGLLECANGGALRAGSRVALVDASRDGVADVVLGAPGLSTFGMDGAACVARPPTSGVLERTVGHVPEMRVIYGVNRDAPEPGWSPAVPVWQLTPLVELAAHAPSPPPASLGLRFVSGTFFDDDSPAARFAHGDVNAVVFALPRFREAGVPGVQGAVIATTWDETTLPYGTLPDGGVADIERPVLTNFDGHPIVGVDRTEFAEAVALLQFSSGGFRTIAVGAPADAGGTVRLYRGSRASTSPTLVSTISFGLGSGWGGLLAR